MRVLLIALSTTAFLACGPPSSSGSRSGGGGGGSDAGNGSALDASLPGRDASNNGVEEICNDGIDNDSDGRTDCEDTECANLFACRDAGAQPVDPAIEQACNQLAATVARQCPEQTEALVAWCRAEYDTINQPSTPLVTCLQSFAATCDLAALQACITTGQGASGFEDLGNGVMEHTATGRQWQQRASTSKRDQDDSRTYCSRLTLGGHSDWQMPTWQQYRSICVPYTDACTWPAEMEGRCGTGLTNTYWAQVHRDTRGQLWDLSVGFAPNSGFNCHRHNNGSVGMGAINTNDTDRLYVRCVREP